MENTISIAFGKSLHVARVENTCLIFQPFMSPHARLYRSALFFFSFVSNPAWLSSLPLIGCFYTTCSLCLCHWVFLLRCSSPFLLYLVNSFLAFLEEGRHMQYWDEWIYGFYVPPKGVTQTTFSMPWILLFPSILGCGEHAVRSFRNGDIIIFFCKGLISEGDSDSDSMSFIDSVTFLVTLNQMNHLFK